MLLFFSTDLHASEVCFRKFLNAIRVYKPDIAILGGDLTGKMIVPIINVNGTYRAKYYGSELTARSENEVKMLISKIADSGYYPYITTKEELESLKEDKQKINDLFQKLSESQIKRWNFIAENKLKNVDVPMYVSGGNDDPSSIIEIVKESEAWIYAGDNVLDVQVKNEEYKMLSLGYSNITPWNCPRDISEEELARKIESLALEVSEMQNCIFNIHVPPYGTPLDLAPKVDEKLNVKMSGGQPVLVNVGSKSVRAAIEKHKPLLGLHGHIHESRGIIKLGPTWCVNPGSEYGEGVLRGVILKIERGRIKDHLFTCG
jgi:Icc-related predicted phosphoesterase